MDLDEALDRYGLALRRRLSGVEAQAAVVSLDALREFLVDHSGYLETTELSDRDLYVFLFEYYPSEVEPDEVVANMLIEVAAGFALWLIEAGDRTLAGFQKRSDSLRRDFGRAIGIYLDLKAELAADSLRAPVDAEDDEGVPLGEISSGVDRMARLDSVDYSLAEEEHYHVVRVAKDGLILRSAERDVLGEGHVGPVRVPESVREVAQMGDVLHLEIAPSGDAWEVIEVFGVRPEGYE